MYMRIDVPVVHIMFGVKKHKSKLNEIKIGHVLPSLFWYRFVINNTMHWFQIKQ